jgi:hypothetical protein
VDHRNTKGAGLAGAVLGTCQDVVAFECQLDGGLLDGTGIFPSLLVNALEQFPSQTHIVPGLGGSRRHIDCFIAHILWG